MTLWLANPSATVTRLAATLARRGHALGGMESAEPRTWILGSEDDPVAAGIVARDDSHDRILVLSWIGTHPDARAEVLRRLWMLEERCRATGIPTLTLRLAPLAGPESPLWKMLAGSQPGARLARKLVHPVLESDVVEAMDRALRGAAVWEGWQEIGGPDIVSLGELAALARTSRVTRGGAWEPDPDALAEQRLIEPAVWARWSGIEPGSVVAEAAQWAA